MRSHPQWLLARVLYRTALVAIFAAVAFDVGPTWIMFGRWTRPTAADYVPFVNQNCLPLLRAMAAYDRDSGEPPWNLDLLAPKYLPHDDPVFWDAFVRDGQVYFNTPGLNVRIRYTPGNGRGEWFAEGPFVNGPIPAQTVPELRRATKDDLGL